MSGMPILPFDGDGDTPVEPPIPSKVCRTCNLNKPLVDFPAHSHYADNRSSECKTCTKMHASNLKRIKRNASSCPKPADNLCECCKLDPSKCNPPRKWCWDHDHDTEKFRGWLCNVCNLSIGQLGDSIEGLMNAIRYLERAQKRHEQDNQSGIP